MKHYVLKRLLSVMLCMVMVVSLLPVSVFAEDVEYEADTAYVTVVCIDGNFELQRFVIECKLGDTITIVPPEIEGELSYDVYYDLPVIITVDKLQYEVTLVYGPSVTYKVYHYKETLNSGEYRLDKTEECLGLICNPTKAKAGNYPGFTAQPIKQEGWIEYDGSTVSSTFVEVYYTRNSYTLTYMLDGEEYVVEKYKYEEAINAAAAPEAPIGHVFSGWIGLPETMPADNVTVTGSFSPRTDLSYTVNYLDENGNEVAAAKTVTGQTFGAEITESAIAVDGYTVDETSKTITIGLEGNEINFYYTAIPVAPAEPAEPTVPAEPTEPEVPAPPVIAVPVIPAAPVVDIPAIPALPQTIVDEDTPLAGGTAVTVEDPMEDIDDEATPLAAAPHTLCILHFLILCAALIILLVYMNEAKKHQQKISELREALGK